MRHAVLVLLLGVAWLAATPDMNAGAAPQRCGTRKPAISRDAYSERRPADFYELCMAIDTEVCSDLQRRLNTQSRHWTIYEDINFAYIGFDVSIDGWDPAPSGYTPLRTRRGNPDPTASLAPRVVLDLNGDGQQEVLYRIRSSIGGREFVIVVWTEWPPGGDRRSEEGVQFRAQPYPHPSKQGMTIGDVFPINILGGSRQSLGPLSTDVTQSAGRYYLVVIRPWNSDSNPISEVWITAMDDARTGRLVCRFESRYRVMRVVPR